MFYKEWLLDNKEYIILLNKDNKEKVIISDNDVNYYNKIY